MRKLLGLVWPLTGKKLLVIAALLLAVFLFLCALTDLGTWLRERAAGRADAKSEQVVQQELQQANQNSAKAEDFKEVRIEHEGAARRAGDEKQRAAERSHQTEAPTRAAQNRYEETRSLGTDDVAPVADGDICTELAKRNIECPRQK